MSRGKGKYGQVAPCPACDAMVTIRKRPHRGQTVVCNSCDSLLEVIHLSPLMLEWAFEEPYEMLKTNVEENEDIFDEWDSADFDQYADDDFYTGYKDDNEDRYSGAFRNGRRV